MKHIVIAAVLVVVVTALLIAGLQQVQLLPVQASAQAVPIDNLFNLEFKIIAFLFSLIVVLMVYSIVVFRRKKGDVTDAAHVEGNTKLEVAWTVAPLATVLFISYLGGESLANTMRSDPQPLKVNATGAQWAWSFEYPDSGVISGELVLPVNKQVLLSLSSKDVIHSFWVPEFRVKQDALPGGPDYVRQLRITPTLIGQYKVLCAELCGMQHTGMTAPVKVVSQADYDSWMAEQSGALNDPVARGRKIAQQQACLSCHSLDGSRLVGPSWKGLYGSDVPLSDGRTAKADEPFLVESVRNPSASIVQGYPPAMPATYTQANLSDEQLKDIIEFIKSLK